MSRSTVVLLFPFVLLILAGLCSIARGQNGTAYNQTLLTSFNTSNPAMSPAYQVAIDTWRSEIVVADQGNNRLVVFNADAPLQSAQVIATPGTISSPALAYPTGVAVASDGTYWVCDTLNAGLVQFNPTNGSVMQRVSRQQLGAVSRTI